MSVSFGNQSTDFRFKLIGWFLYDEWIVLIWARSRLIVFQSKLRNCIESDGPTFSVRNSCNFMVNTSFNMLLVTPVNHFFDYGRLLVIYI